MTWFISQAYAEEATAPVEGAEAGAATTATTAHEGGGHGGVFPPFNPAFFPSQLVWLAIVFAILYRLMSKKIIPEITGIIEARAETVKADIEKAEASRDASEAAVAAYEASLAAAKAKAQSIAAETRARVGREIAGERHAAEAQLANRLELAEKHVSDVKAIALAHVGSIAVEATSALVDTLVGPANPDEVAAAVASAEKR
jgi:F-type H+-transporting ATPase subunit b